MYSFSPGKSLFFGWAVGLKRPSILYNEKKQRFYFGFTEISENHVFSYVEPFFVALFALIFYIFYIDEPFFIFLFFSALALFWEGQLESWNQWNVGQVIRDGEYEAEQATTAYEKINGKNEGGDFQLGARIYKPKS